MSVSVSESVCVSVRLQASLCGGKKSVVNQCLEFVSVLVSVSDLVYVSMSELVSVSVSVSLSLSHPKPHFVGGRMSKTSA